MGRGHGGSRESRRRSDPCLPLPSSPQVVHAYGADALRLYLINSPVVRAEPLRFKEAGVLGVVRDVFLPWYNALRFFAQNAARLRPATAAGADAESARPAFRVDPALAAASTNAMDRWVYAAVQGLVKFVR